MQTHVEPIGSRLRALRVLHQPVSESSHLADGAINKRVKRYDSVKVPLSANNPLLSSYSQVRMNSNLE